MAVAVIYDRQGRLVIQKRTKQQQLGGWWEFPGGKVAEGESPLKAAVREVREELGIDISGQVVEGETTCVRHSYVADTLIEIHAFTARLEGDQICEGRVFAGQTFKGREGQQVQCIDPATLHTYELLPASWNILWQLRSASLLALTQQPSEGLFKRAAEIGALVRVLDSGAAPQHADVIYTAASAQRLTAFPEHKRWHLPETLWRTLPKRPRDRSYWLGVSAHSSETLLESLRWEADYVLFSPVAQSRHDRPALGWEHTAEILAPNSAPACVSSRRCIAQ